MSIRSCLLALALAGATAAHADTLVPSDQGYVQRTSSLFGVQITHDPADTTLRVQDFAFFGGVGTVVTRQNAYLWFDVPAQLPDASAAVLRLGLDNNGPLVGSVQAWDVTSPPAAFAVAYANSAEQAARDLVADLQSGVAYGSAALPLGAALSVELVLSPQGVADLMAARGHSFAIGLSGGLGSGALSLPAVFGSAALEVTAVPEPGSAALLLAGLAAWAARRRRPR